MWRRLQDGHGQPPRLMAGPAILKHTYNLSDEGMSTLWIENPLTIFLR
jgi:IS5 family transposase